MERPSLMMGRANLPVSSALIAAALLGATFGAGSARAQISFTGSYTQNFDSLASTGTSNTFTNNITIPGWYSDQIDYDAGTGSSNAGGLYSFGSAGTSERALGSVASNNAAVGTVFYGVLLQNNSAGVIDSLTVSYTGEQWRNGGNTTPHSLTFGYFNAGTNGSNQLESGTYTNAPALNFTSLQNTATQGALNGNAAANRAAISSTITGLNFQTSQYLWLRWTDLNDPGSDHGLAVDDFSLSATALPPGGAAPEPGTLAILLPALPVIGLLANRRRKK